MIERRDNHCFFLEYDCISGLRLGALMHKILVLGVPNSMSQRIVVRELVLLPAPEERQSVWKNRWNAISRG
jgi:hypothetical protein